jgi:hypothetical protein
MINRESAIFCAAALAASLVLSAVGFSLAALPREAVEAAKKPALAETLPDIDLGGGFGRVSVIDLIGYYIENPPAPAAAGGEVPAARRFGGC